MPAYVDFPRETFDRALRRRGLTARRFCELAGVHEQIVSQARCGHRRVTVATWERLTAALARIPVLPGVLALEAEEQAAQTRAEVA